MKAKKYNKTLFHKNKTGQDEEADLDREPQVRGHYREEHARGGL